MRKRGAEQTNTKMNSVIGTDMIVEGNIKAKETIRVEGCVTGNVETEGVLSISTSGKVKGNVKGSGVVIGGVLEGDLVCSGKTEVISTGKMYGNMHTRSLIVDENAVFQGQCVMNEEEVTKRMNEGEEPRNEEQQEERNNGQKKR